MPKAYAESITEYIDVVVPSILTEVPPGHDLEACRAVLEIVENHENKKRLAERLGHVDVGRLL